MNGLLLNLIEVQFNKDQIEIAKTTYDKAKWDRYVKNVQDYYFYRDGADIYAWRLSAQTESLPSEFSSQVVAMNDKPRLFERILEQAVVTLLRKNNYHIYLNKYSSTWGVGLKGANQGNPVILQGLKLSPYMDMGFHNFYSQKSSKLFIGITLRKRYKPEFIYAEEEFESKSIDTRNWSRNFENKLIATRENVEKYLLASGQHDQYFSVNKSLYSDENFGKDLDSLYSSIKQIKDRFYLPDGLQVSNFLLNNLPNAYFDNEQVKKPNYYYYNERTKSRSYYDQSLEELKPSTYNLFVSKTVKIIILTPQIYEGVSGSFSKRLEGNLHKIFHLQKLDIILEAFDDNEGYVGTIERLNLTDVDLVVIILSEQDKEYAISSSPYYLSKAKLLNQKIPSQDVTIEKIKQQYPFIEKNIALNIYSKLGGVAWTIEKDEKDKKELIVGVGSTVDSQNNRLIGFANVFDYNGTYLVGDCSHISTDDNYVENLEKHLLDMVGSVVESKQIEKTTPFRLIFHLKKAVGIRTELQAINNALSNYSDYNIQYALMHLSYGHNFKLTNNNGNYEVKRGTFIQLSPTEALLHLGGSDSLPIYIKVDGRSTYKDLYALCQQVLYFAHLSHRSFIPANEPVTTKYPSIMANLTANLSQLNNWDTSQLNKLKDKLWFI